MPFSKKKKQKNLNVFLYQNQKIMTDTININKILITFGIIFSTFLIFYIVQFCILSSENEVITTETDITENNSTTTLNNTQKIIRKRPILHILPPQPVCTKYEHEQQKIIEILDEIQLKQTQCTFQQKLYYEKLWLAKAASEKYKFDANFKQQQKLKENDYIVGNESRGTGVVWCVVGLLIVSMIASIIDVFNAKKPRFQKVFIALVFS